MSRHPGESMPKMCKWCGNRLARNDTLKHHFNCGCPALVRGMGNMMVVVR